ncbi:MAG: ketoacyl-ACP synthase III [Bryobacteraceae bacterium]|jgi:3-oxoacyl-[acyl-carrier-protein] synthase-3
MSIHSKVVATGHFLPEIEIRNADLTQFPPASIALIEEKTGVRARRHAPRSQCTSDLGALASRECLDRAGFDAANLDVLILATSSPDRIQPATATRVQHFIGATRAYAFDVNSVCSGGIYAMQLADALIRSESARSALVVASEVYSRFLNRMDFATYPYFGDGAGAVLLTRSNEGPGILDCVLGSDGAGADLIRIPAGGSMLPYADMTNPSDAFFKMRGKEVFQFAVEKGPSVIAALETRCGLKAEEISWVVAHQANVNILKEISAKCGIPFHKFPVNLDRYGNTAAASVLIAFDELMTSGNTRPGEVAILVAFGGGLSWGGLALRL